MGSKWLWYLDSTSKCEISVLFKMTIFPKNWKLNYLQLFKFMIINILDVNFKICEGGS